MAIEKLTARKVDAIKAPGRYSDGGGLWLQVTNGAGNKPTKSWVFQYVSPTKPRKIKIKNGKEVEVGQVRQLGLGALHTVSLAEARDLAATYRKQVAKGIDPLDLKEAKRQAKRSDEVALITFKSCAEKYIAAHRSSWKNTKHREQWASTLKTYAFPFIGDLSVARIDTPLVLQCIEPLWSTKTETASRLRGRIESVLDWAKVSGYREGENPARWKGHLDHRLPKPSKTTRRKHLPALPYADLVPFLTELKAHKGISPRALETTILTALRTSEVINATWDEIDLSAKVWTVPAERMKGNREHRVPLSDRVLAILKALPRERGHPFVFLGGKSGQPLSNMAMLELLKELRPGLTVHGFRSTFRTWASEQTNYPYEVCEVVLAHAVGSAASQAYQRGDLFEKRRRLMVDWAKYCAQKPTGRTNNVTTIRTRVSS
jgi:integrase